MPEMNEDKEPGLHHKMMKHTGKFFDDFRQFAVRGNAVDLAVGVVIGAAFGKIITSLVSDIITPPISLLLGHVNFANLFINISGVPYATLEEAKTAGAATINYGAFLSAILDFVLIALIIFMVVKTLSRMRRETPPPA